MLINHSERFSDSVIIPGRCAFQAAIDALPQRAEKRQPHPIPPEGIVVVEKKSLWELDRERYSHDDLALKQFYQEQGVSADKIYQSHLAQKEARAEIRRIFPEAICVGRDRVAEALQNTPALIVSLGGDNHAQWVSHLICDSTPFIGVNSDPQNSVGALLQADVQQLTQLRANLIDGRYRFLPYSRIKVVLNGEMLPLALSEVFVGDKYRMNISRYYSETPRDVGGALERKDSGLLLATGSGSTGWFRSSVRSHFHFSPEFEPTTAGAAYHATESFSLSNESIGSGVIKLDQEIRITSRFNRSGVISIDSDQEALVAFPRGAVAVLTIAPEPLWVIGN